MKKPFHLLPPFKAGYRGTTFVVFDGGNRVVARVAAFGGSGRENSEWIAEIMNKEAEKEILTGKQ